MPPSLPTQSSRQTSVPSASCVTIEHPSRLSTPSCTCFPSAEKDLHYLSCHSCSALRPPLAPRDLRDRVNQSSGCYQCLLRLVPLSYLCFCTLHSLTNIIVLILQRLCLLQNVRPSVPEDHRQQTYFTYQLITLFVPVAFQAATL
ncbi:hypothetical protein ACET3X_004819 [Alternaria dauci]|uniref:Uncharacterized protein n=1 Tax=Alternaria dauci TaxID=48095 RepID=A0ABR3UKZ1_9PLEO